MHKENIYDDDCPILHALNIIGGKWRLLVLYQLLDGGLRYNQLKKKLCGITNIMLTRSLRHLEAYGLVKRIEYLEIPSHVEYLLTEHAKKLVPALVVVAEWGKEQMLLEKEE